jgi:hypothetical protein
MRCIDGDAPSLNDEGMNLLRWRNDARLTLRKPDTLKTSDRHLVCAAAARNRAPNAASGATLREMKRALKTLLLWLLISLFPLQGMAGAMSPSCGNAAASAAAVSSEHTAFDQIDHHAAPAHCPSHDADDCADAADSATTHHASCSACAACCIGASAPPSNQPPAASHAMSESDFATLDLLGGDFIPAGLERPPKFS